MSALNFNRSILTPILEVQTLTLWLGLSPRHIAALHAWPNARDLWWDRFCAYSSLFKTANLVELTSIYKLASQIVLQSSSHFDSGQFVVSSTLHVSCILLRKAQSLYSCLWRRFFWQKLFTIMSLQVLRGQKPVFANFGHDSVLAHDAPSMQSVKRQCVVERQTARSVRTNVAVRQNQGSGDRFYFVVRFFLLCFACRAYIPY